MIGICIDNDGFFMPHVFCDHCGEPVKGFGNVLWLNPPGWKSGMTFAPRFFHTHKRCNRAFEKAYKAEHGEVHFSWGDLSEHLTQLLSNTALPDDRDCNRVLSIVDKANRKTTATNADAF